MMRWYTPMLLWWGMLFLDVTGGNAMTEHREFHLGWYLGSAIPAHLWSLSRATRRQRQTRQRPPTGPEDQTPPGPPAMQG